jgi:hypothetical protein
VPAARHSPRYRWPRRREPADQVKETTKAKTRSDRHTSLRTVANRRHTAGRGASPVGVYTRTPRPMRSRVTTAGGRSPGSRVSAFDHLPRNRTVPSGTFGRKLAAHSCGDSCGVARRSARTAFPF